MKKYLAFFAVTLAAAPVFAAEPDGLILPPGFHASVVAEGLGANVRHLAFGPNGDLYVSTNTIRDKPVTGILALHLDASHKAVQTEHFGTAAGGTGIRVYKGGLYVATPTTVYRYAL